MLDFFSKHLMPSVSQPSVLRSRFCNRNIIACDCLCAWMEIKEKVVENSELAEGMTDALFFQKIQ